MTDDRTAPTAPPVPRSASMHVPVGAAQRREPAGMPTVVRHVIGVVVGLLVTPIGIAVLDGGAAYFGDPAITDSAEEPWALVMFIGGMALLALVAASARLSGLGPVVAGTSWGVLPLLGSVVDVAVLQRLAEELPDSYSPTYFYPALAALLIGAGTGGRWNGRHH